MLWRIVSYGLVTEPCGLVTEPCGLVTEPCDLVTDPCGLLFSVTLLALPKHKKKHWKSRESTANLLINHEIYSQNLWTPIFFKRRHSDISNLWRSRDSDNRAIDFYKLKEIMWAYQILPEETQWVSQRLKPEPNDAHILVASDLILKENQKDEYDNAFERGGSYRSWGNNSISSWKKIKLTIGKLHFKKTGDNIPLPVQKGDNVQRITRSI